MNFFEMIMLDNFELKEFMANCAECFLEAKEYDFDDHQTPLLFAFSFRIPMLVQKEVQVTRP